MIKKSRKVKSQILCQEVEVKIYFSFFVGFYGKGSKNQSGKMTYTNDVELYNYQT